MLISIGVKINRVDRISGGRVNGLDIYIRGTTDLNQGPSGITMEILRCSESRSIYGVKGIEVGSEEIVGCTNSGCKGLDKRVVRI